MPFEDRIAEYQARKAKAQAMGSPRKLVGKAERGELNARQRVDYLVEPGSFREIGPFAVSARLEDRERSPTGGVERHLLHTWPTGC